MNLTFSRIKYSALGLLFFLMTISAFSQSDTSKWKAQIAFGFNYPDVDGFVPGFEAKPINFPTINLGVQHMFTPKFGAKLDYGFNRFSNADDSAEFKTNYARINAQFVYDATQDFRFLPMGMGFVAHAGPGMSFIKPLGNYGANKHSFFNAMAGAELHFRISRSLSVFTDVSYIMGFTSDKEYDPISKGYGTFNGNLFTVTLGLSVSLSGCQYCD